MDKITNVELVTSSDKKDFEVKLEAAVQGSNFRPADIKFQVSSFGPHNHHLYSALVIWRN